jgi:hypothetical protein
MTDAKALKDGKPLTPAKRISKGTILIAVFTLTIGVGVYLFAGFNFRAEVSSSSLVQDTSSPDSYYIMALRRADKIYKRNIRRRDEMYPTPPRTRIEALDYYTAVYPCVVEERIGRWTDGGKWICGADRLGSSAVVYSIGSNGDCSFEEDLFDVCRGCEIHVFDMTLKGDKRSRILEAQRQGHLVFHDYGVSAVTNKTTRTKNLQSVMHSLNHKFIDIFKIDCEMCEWEVFEQILASTKKVLWGQVQVEVHYYNNTAAWNPFMRGLEARGYRLFHVELNWRFMAGIELSFIHESLVKPSKILSSMT